VTVKGLPVEFLQRLLKYNQVTLEASGSSFLSIHYYTQVKYDIYVIGEIRVTRQVQFVPHCSWERPDHLIWLPLVGFCSIEGH